MVAKQKAMSVQQKNALVQGLGLRAFQRFFEKVVGDMHPGEFAQSFVDGCAYRGLTFASLNLEVQKWLQEKAKNRYTTPLPSPWKPIGLISPPMAWAPGVTVQTKKRGDRTAVPISV